MKPVLRAALLGLALVAPLTFAAERATREEALALVRKAQAHIKTAGKETALADFSNPKGPFVDRDLYIVVVDLNGKVLAHGANPRMVGKVLLEIKDPDGKAFVREEIEVAKTKGRGWVEFKFVNPVTKDIEPRAVYLENMGDYFVASGVFMN